MVHTTKEYVTLLANSVIANQVRRIHTNSPHYTLLYRQQHTFSNESIPFIIFNVISIFFLGVGGLKCDRCEAGFWGLHKISEGNLNSFLL